MLCGILKQNYMKSFLEYHSELMGYDFYLNGVPVYKYQLYLMKVSSVLLLSGKTKYQKKQKNNKNGIIY